MKRLLMIILLGTSQLTMGQPQQSLQFEVATVKPGRAENRGAVLPNSCRGTDTRPDPRVTIPLGRCIFQNAFLSYLIREAYEDEMAFWSPRVGDAVTGGPSWTNSERFEIEGKAGDASATGRDLRRMLQALLADRFKLKLRRESKEVSGYVLVVTKNGPKLSSAKDTDTRPQITGTRPSPTALTSIGKNASLANLAVSLSGLGIGLVVDKTGLQGSYDFTLTFELDTGMQLKKAEASAPAERGSGPSLFTALEEQLGLKLVSQKVSVESLVIESADRPSPN